MIFQKKDNSARSLSRTFCDATMLSYFIWHFSSCLLSWSLSCIHRSISDSIFVIVCLLMISDVTWGTSKASVLKPNKKKTYRATSLSTIPKHLWFNTIPHQTTFLSMISHFFLALLEACSKDFFFLGDLTGNPVGLLAAVGNRELDEELLNVGLE